MQDNNNVWGQNKAPPELAIMELAIRDFDIGIWAFTNIFISKEAWIKLYKG